MIPVDYVHDAIVDLAAGRITRDEAIASVMAVLNVTALGAADLLDHPIAPRARYEAAFRAAAEGIRRLGGEPA